MPIKFILFVVILYLILTFPLPYTITNGGGIINLNDRIKVENQEKKQNINMCYVNQLKGNIATYLMSYVIPHWDLEKIEDEDYNFDEEITRNKILLQESIDNATINAFKLSNKKYTITNQKVYVSYVLAQAKTDLQVGDQIIKANNKIIHNADEYRNIVKTLNVGDTISIEVLNNEKTEIRTAEIIELNNEKITGISVTTNYDIKTNPIIKINFKYNESGPSGGLMLSLGIYEKINNITLYNGKKICGTGTIDSKGNIGEIGGVKYKLRGAVNNKCDIFLSPEDNFEEVKNEKKKNNYKINIYEAKTLKETINYLTK